MKEESVTTAQREPLDLSLVRVEVDQNVQPHLTRTRKRRKKKEKTKKHPVRTVLLVLLLILLLGTTTAGVTFYSGKKALLAEAAKAPVMQGSEVQTLEDQRISYRGGTYEYNTSMVNLLLIGVDSSGKEGQEEIQGIGNGQSDLLLLVSLDTKDNTVTIIQINRDTIADITIQNTEGKGSGTSKAQLALAYAYGNDDKESSALTMKAVSDLFHGLSIQGYFTVNTSAIPLVNDAVGGVEVTLPEDFVKEWGDGYVKGSRVLLKGSMAEDYVRARLGKQDATNVGRMQRQKEYLISLIRKVMQMTKSDIKLLVSLYTKLQPYMTTNISLNEFTYLASEAVSCDFSGERLMTLEGTINDSGKYVEFYPDEEKLCDLMVNVYYNEVTE